MPQAVDVHTSRTGLKEISRHDQVVHGNGQNYNRQHYFKEVANMMTQAGEPRMLRLVYCDCSLRTQFEQRVLRDFQLTLHGWSLQYAVPTLESSRWKVVVTLISFLPRASSSWLPNLSCQSTSV